MTDRQTIASPNSAASGKNGSPCDTPDRDDEIDPLTPRNGQPAEFDSWRWERLDRVADLVVPFRRDVYHAVARSFAEFAETGYGAMLSTDTRRWI